MAWPLSLLLGEQPVERAVEIAAVVGDRLGDEGQHRRRHVEAGMVEPRRRDPPLQDLEPQLLVQRAHFHDQPAGKPRAHAVVQAFEIGGRAIGRDHHLTAGIDQRIERMAELRLGGLSLQKLQIVDDQNVDAAQRFLEGERRLGFQGGDEPVHEFLGGEIEHPALARRVAGPGDRLEEMRLAEPHASVDIERIEHHRIAAPRHRDLLGGGMCERVGAADRERVECQARIERRAAERLVSGRDRPRRRGRRHILDRIAPASRTGSAAVSTLIVALGRSAERCTRSTRRIEGSSAFHRRAAYRRSAPAPSS